MGHPSAAPPVGILPAAVSSASMPRPPSSVSSGPDERSALFGPPTTLERDLWARPESRLLLLSARTCPPPLTEATEGVDWPTFRKLVFAHRLVPHVARSLSEVPTVPSGFRHALQQAEADNAWRQLEMARVLTVVLGALGEAGVPALPIKGPALASWLFGDPARRTSIDLDVLVAPDALAEAFAVVGRIGFESGGKVRGLTAAEAEVVATEFQLKDAAFIHPEWRVSLEIHWRPFRDRGLSTLAEGLAADLRVDTTGLAWRNTRVSAAGAAFVLAHGAMHGYRRLTWLADAAALSERLDEAAWEEVVALAAADGFEGAVLLGPYLAHRLLGAPVPEAVRPRIEAHLPRLRRLAGWCLTETPDHERQMHPATAALGAGLYDRSGDRLRHLWHLLVSPASGELAEADLRPGAAARARRIAARPARLVRNGARWVTGQR